MAEVVVVTEFPGKTDLATGRLLSGATGKIFWELAEESGLTQHHITVLPVISSRPGSGKIEDFCLCKRMRKFNPRFLEEVSMKELL